LPRCEGKERWELVWGELGFFAGNDMYVHAYVYLGLMDEEVSPYSGCLLFMTNAFGRELLKKVQHFFERLGLNATEVFMLMSIVREPGITVGKLAKEVILDPSTVSRAVLQLERKGFVFRNTMGSRVEVLPTPEGRKKERDARAAWGKARDYYEGKFTAQRSTEWSGSLANALAYMYEEE
jgi:DNA-binding MarR family transcriptional regulator